MMRKKLKLTGLRKLKGKLYTKKVTTPNVPDTIYPDTYQACLVGDTSFLAIFSTWLHRYYLNWTELNDNITESMMNWL